MRSLPALALLGLAAVVLLAPHANAVIPPATADAGLYRFIDSNDPSWPYGAMTWGPNDISLTGANVPTLVKDGPSAALVLPADFKFNFYGTNYAGANVYVHENGYIGLNLAEMTTGPDPTSFTPVSAPNTANPNHYIAGLFVNNEQVACSGTIRYAMVGTAPDREFVVQWTDVPLYEPPAPCSATLVTFQIRLQENTGDVRVWMKNAAYVPAAGGSGQGTLVGIESDGANTDAMTPTLDDGGLTYFWQGPGTTAVDLSNRAILFYRDATPVAAPATVALDEDCTTTVPTSGCATPVTVPLAGADIDDPANGDSIRGYCIETQPSYGSLAGAPPSCGAYPYTFAAPAGGCPCPTFDVVTYNPDADYCNGVPFTVPDYLEFRVVDSAWNAYGPTASQPVKVKFDVQCQADPPAPVADGYTMNEDCSATSATSCGSSYLLIGTSCLTPPFGVKCNDVDVDDVQFAPATPNLDAEPVTIVTGPGAGTLLMFNGAGPSPAISLTGGFRYRPNSNFCGSDSFTYQLEDNYAPTGLTPPAYSNVGTVTITVTCINDPPAAGFTHPVSVPVGTPVGFTDTSSDPDGSAELHDWLWDFNDGTSSTDRYAQHTYSSAGDYAVCLTVKDNSGLSGVGCSTMSITISGGVPNDGPAAGDPSPGAFAGDDFAASEGATVTLHGIANGVDATSWHWHQVSGIAVDLKDADTQDATFAAPTLADGNSVELGFALVVGDGTHESLPDDVVVTISIANHHPIAKAGGSIQAHEGDKVTLDGSGSTDADNDALTYLWKARGTGAPALDSATAKAPSFTVPAGSVGRTFVYTLEVSDSKSTNTDTVQVLVVSKLYTGPGFTLQSGDKGLVTADPVVTADDFVWDFGDGSDPVASTGPIDHTYKVQGNYTVRMLAKSTDGAILLFQQTTLVTSAPPAPVTTAERPTAAVKATEASDSFPIWGWFVGGAGVLLILLAMLAVAVWARN